MFARNHDKFLRNFVDKGAIKILKLKEKVFWARNASKFIAPITVRLKVDYSSYEGMYSVGFIKPTSTKSEFIIMNNYGKVEEITSGLYKRLFHNALGDEMSKVKKLCVGKLLLSLNYVLKEMK